MSNRLKKWKELLENQELEIEVYAEGLFRKLIDKIIVYDSTLNIVFKSGFEIEFENY